VLDCTAFSSEWICHAGDKKQFKFDFLCLEKQAYMEVTFACESVKQPEMPVVAVLCPL